MPDKSDKSPNKEEDEVLDLIDDPKKMSRRERQRARVEALENPRAHRVEKAKSEALDLFSDDKSKKRKGKSDADSAKAEQKADDKAPEPAAKAEDSGSDDSSDAENDQSKLIVIKPPILVPDLAERLGLKPFNVMADLIK
ncbi:MAG: translation initiation factor IF-2, partial [Akkermansiaceae bacterium]|nr:translation initiation factor IF-2 [Akkermansiaceae bacterium]